jgi:DNA-binding MarR family transcriptional regulator
VSSAEPAERLGYLLKHARERLSALTEQALAPYGVDGRELAVLVTLTAGEPASQQEAAQRLGVDRTTMVGLLDVLEGKGLVIRRPDATDRRRNLVELTAAGKATVRGGGQAAAEAEREFLKPLSGSAAAELKAALRVLVLAHRGES